jgi:hypothetical protein
MSPKGRSGAAGSGSRHCAWSCSRPAQCSYCEQNHPRALCSWVALQWMESGISGGTSCPARGRLEQAKRDWKEGRFPKVPGETEFIPLPEE